jgi:hypothetical protein
VCAAEHLIEFTLMVAFRVLDHLENIFRANAYHVLRYNSRGVGRSTGWPSLTGFNEGTDLVALVQWALGTAVKDVKSLILVVRADIPAVSVSDQRILRGTLTVL